MKLALACLLAATTASADPGRVAALDPAAQPELSSTTSATRAPTLDSATYLSTGVALGADGAVDWLYGATSIDAGYRLNPGWWLHGELSGGARIGYGPVNNAPTIVAPEHFVGDVRGGFEWRACRVVCGMVGIDAGYRSGDALTGVQVVPRFGLDFGGEHLRFRPGIELPITFVHRDPESDVPWLPDAGIDLDLRVAYQW